MVKRILIIDDDFGIRRIAQISLQAIAGWEVLLAADAAAGLAIAHSTPLDAILLDVMLPETDGIAILHSLQSSPLTAAIPVILLTAKAQGTERQQLAELPVTGIITKPFKALFLVEQIRSLLNWNELI
jgi:DNA-binding response OmpR family regulator